MDFRNLAIWIVGLSLWLIPNLVAGQDFTSSIRSAQVSFTQDSIIHQDIHSFLVMRNDSLKAEHYFNGYHRDSLNNLKSITKSVVALLVGIAVEEGFIEGLDASITSYFGECNETQQFQEKSSITIRNLLLMQSGIKWNNNGRIKEDWWYHESPHCFMLSNTEMDTIPGRKFSYSSGTSHLLSGIISRTSGMSLFDFAMKYLFQPIGISNVRWETDSNGEFLGNSELYLTPRDLLKLGKLLLNEGVFKDKEIVSTEWIQEIHESAYSASRLMDYGYLWMTSKDEEPYFYFAGGSGGQHLFIVPDHNLLIVTTGHWDNARSTREIVDIAVRFIRASTQ